MKISRLFFLLLLFSFSAAALCATDDAEETMKTLEKEMSQFAEGYKKLSGFSMDKANPMQQKFYQLATDDKFQKAAMDLWAHPARNNMLIVQGIFFLFMVIFKAWRLSKVGNWFLRFLWSFVFNVFTMVVISYVIPFFMLGEPFRVFTGTIWRLFISS